MDKEKLENLCCVKLGRELAAYKETVLEKSKEEIYGAAYEIDSIINIYEFLAEETGNLGEGLLEAMLVFPGLLLFLYQRWLACEDSYQKELSHCMFQGLAKLGFAEDGSTNKKRAKEKSE